VLNDQYNDQVVMINIKRVCPLYERPGSWLKYYPILLAIKELS